MLKQYLKQNFPAILLLLVCIIAYLPLSSFAFALKNDAFIYNFPNKFFFSEAIHNGVLPTWNPYLNNGFPLYADPGFAWWHPITWIFGLLGYNAYTFTIEVLLYIYIAGLGMYWLGKVLNFSKATCYAMACMFMCCGFFIGNLQHVNFLTCAAFLPWLVGSWLKYQENPDVKHLFLCGLAAYLLCTGGHPAIPIGTAYFILFITIFYFIYKYKNINHLKFIVTQLKLTGIILLFLFPLIYSYLIIQPYYTRFEPTNQLESTAVGFTIPSFISFILPFATIKNLAFFKTDVSMRNAYFSFAGFIFFVFFLLNKNKSKTALNFFWPGILMLLLSAGGIIKVMVYEHLPGLNYIRTNGEFRVFSIFSFITCSAYPLNAFFLNKKLSTKWNKKILGWIIVCLLSGIVIFLLLFLKLSYANITGPFKEVIKNYIDNLDFKQSILIGFILLLIISTAYAFSITRTKLILFTLIALSFDLIINCWFLLPITGVGKTSVATIQNILNKSPQGFPTPSLIGNTIKMPLSQDEEKLIGDWNWYSKQLPSTHDMDYPSRLKSDFASFQLPDKKIGIRPFVFLKNGNGTLRIKKINPTEIDLITFINQADTLIVLQNAFPGWKVWVNQKEASINLYRSDFIKLAVDEKTKNIRFLFSIL